MTGCAMAVKWSAIWYVILFVILMFVWEVGTRRSAGVQHPWRDTLLDETGWIVVFGVIFVLVYLASWTGWFVTSHGYDRQWYASTHNGHTLPPVINALRNLYQRALQERTATLATRNSEYGERIEHQAATIDVLKAMSASPGDPSRCSI